MSRPRLKRHAQPEPATDNLPAGLVTLTRGGDAASEAYRTLRTNLHYGLIDAPPKSIVVTSPGPKEGKSTTCANLGVALAQADKKVLILDCDFHKPAMHKFFGLDNLLGVVDVLVGEVSLQEIWHEPLPGLKIGTVGSMPPNPAELLGSERFAEMLDEVRQQFDYVLMDAPPTRVVSDPLVLSAQGDGVLLVIDFKNTSKGSVRHSVRSLKSVGANVLGTVINKVETPKVDYYGYDY